ncbi:indolepyruvate ferredoxin oxidoreductase family protein [Candidatus Kaiserbacteria bacterium]|nr:indolepyruvate ferredoxin oxidoreductase family protein [Candidatus Kaiserbacteria bacterium]
MSENKLARDQFSIPREPARKRFTAKQAVLYALLVQRERDKAAGLNTAGYITGYQGSPLGDTDIAWRPAIKLGALNDANIVFQPGLNEDLAAGSIAGTQQTQLIGDASYDGVFALWYGKGPGLDRSTDQLRQMVAAGVAPHGGIVILVGDDHACASSTIAYQSEKLFAHIEAPVLVPHSVQEVFDFMLKAIAMSRFSGTPVGLKVPTDLAEASAVIMVDPYQTITMPRMPVNPSDDIYIRLGMTPREQEVAKPRRLERAQFFAEANGINVIEHNASKPRLCIVAPGRSYAETMEALHLLHIDERARHGLGIAVMRVGMSWPLSANTKLMQILAGYSHILVVEEKAAIVEDQLKAAFYNLHKRPHVFGKSGPFGASLLPNIGVLTHAQIAEAIAQMMLACDMDCADVIQRARTLRAIEARAWAPAISNDVRKPHMCSGCPHSTSLQNPAGATAFSGIGCHYMAEWMDPSRRAIMETSRRAVLVTPMGGEGMGAIMHLLFSKKRHVFQNLGDGTYGHSGSLAIRASVAASKLWPDKGLTYVILYNSAVAMTGGQDVEGGPTVPQLTHQLRAEGVKTIVIVSEDPLRYNRGDLADGVAVCPRSELLQVKTQMQSVTGVSVIIYDQGCAAEKRRKRKRGILPDPDMRVYINPRVCEGCGDCSQKSNCPSVQPLETAFGTKRQIDQSHCNKDYRCVEGFCPSFVLVKGAQLRDRRDLAAKLAQAELPEPPLPVIGESYNMLFKGIGGTGVTTIDGVLGQAGYLANLWILFLALSGLSQKGGEVDGHARLSLNPVDELSTRIPAGETDVLFGFDLVGASRPASLAMLTRGRSHVVVNTHATPTSQFIFDRSAAIDTDQLLSALKEAVGSDRVYAIDAIAYTKELFGDSIYANMFLVGFAYQHGLVPIASAVIRKAIAQNGASVDMNLQAFACGRYAAAFPTAFESLGWWWKVSLEENRLPSSQEERIRFYESELVAYQGRAYADRYLELVRVAQTLDLHHGRAESPLLTEAVIRYFYKLLAYKDEYEVARLHTDGRFDRQLKREFSKYGKLISSLAPPMMGTEKREFGPWMRVVMRVALSKLKFLRGTWVDPFGYAAHRKEERELIRRYESLIVEMGYGLNVDNYDLAVQLLSIPEEIRGYGHIKQASIEKVKPKAEALLRLFREKVKMA